MKIGFIGLGHMGTAMAANLVKAGHEVTVFNRSPGKSRALIELGAREATGLADACDGEAVITMLANDDAACDITLGAEGIIAHLHKGAIHLSMSTISVAAGDPAAVEACKPLFDALGQKTSTIGMEPSAANLVKLTANFLQASVIEALGEAIALIGKAGIDRIAYVNLLTSTIFTSPAYTIFGPLIAAGTFGPAAFAAPLGFKDIRLALAEAETLRVPMPLASLLHDRFLRLFAQGGEKLDWSAIGGLASQDAGANQATTSLMSAAV